MKPHTHFQGLSAAVGVGALLGMALLAPSALPEPEPRTVPAPAVHASEISTGKTVPPSPVTTTSLMSFRPSVTATPAVPPLGD